MFRLTRRQVREVDRRAIEDLGLPGVVLMENAGRNAARVVLDTLRGRRGAAPGGRRVGVLCGGGNNGGDGYVIARHLHNAGVGVTLLPAIDPGELKGDARVNATVALKMDLRFAFIRDAAELREQAGAMAHASLLVDALLGTGFAGGAVRPHLAAVIRACNGLHVGPRGQAGGGGGGVVVVAIDLPSGLDCDTGRPAEPTIGADVTVTFVAEKVGFATAEAGRCLGRVVVADIGTPPELTRRVLREVR